MLRAITILQGFAIQATDGEIGKVDQFYFDDETWAIRYLVVSTGSWLSGRRLLISPIAVTETNWTGKKLNVALTKKQVEGSPDINTDKPVSRQHEADTLGYYGYPFYWGGAFLWGSVSYPAGIRKSVAFEPSSSKTEKQLMDSHLRSTSEVIGYYVHAVDGEIGHVEDFLVDEETWAIRYVEVDTRNWWSGKKVLVSPQWIQRVSWTESKVYVDLLQETIKNGPEYVEPVTRDYEGKLHEHYSREAYWLQGKEQPYSPTVRG